MRERVAERIEGLVVGRKGDGRSIYSATGKRALIHACLQPGISVAGSALANGVNANLLRKWIRQFQDKQPRTHWPSAASTTNRHPLIPLLPIQLTDPIPREEAGPERTTVKSATPIDAPSDPIEIEIAGAKLILRGSVDARQLRLVLSCLAHLSPFRETK